VSDSVLTVWSIVKWPAMLFVMAMIVAVLYYASPNVQQPRFRWMSVGAGLAIFLWVLGSVAFGFYVQTFGSYDRTYGSLAGTIVLLLWLWLTNTALLFGGEFDAELERARQLEAGIVAEETLQLPPRDTAVSEKAAATLSDDIASGRELRHRAHPEQVNAVVRQSDRSVSAAAMFVLALVLGRRRRSRSHAR
jgi:membrane protein